MTPSPDAAATKRSLMARWRKPLLVGLAVVYVLLGVLAWRLFAPAPDPVSPEPFIIGSASCAECHEDMHAAWMGSHHQRAMRKLEPGLDDEAFLPGHEIRHGTMSSRADAEGGQYRLVTQGPTGAEEAFHPELVIGVAPLWQYLMPFEDGRWQATELAWDPAKKEWFNVFEEQDRRHFEWGHWTGRGMNWNSMCADCHMTGYDKGYEPVSDSYQTTWVELGVGCEGCHGPYGQHVEWHRSRPDGERWPGARRLTVRQQLDTCGACHARRGELTGSFRPGDDFLDHYRPMLPGLEDIYYADGQILDEDFEYGSFLLSAMHGMRVSCLNCHDPHSGKTRREVFDNSLCLSCHSATIDTVAHGRHEAGSEGNQCVGCHMPLTTYMARHPRRDHGFTIPDPLLTKEFGIPNACNRCHVEEAEGVDWALEWVEKWYGERMDRPTRARARTIARGRTGDQTTIPDLVKLAAGDPYPAWRAVALDLLAQWPEHPQARAALQAGLEQEHALVRAAAARGLGPLPAEHERLEPLLEDPVRLVRVDAAWALRERLDMQSRAGQDLMAMLRRQSDQPPALMQMGQLAYDRGEHEEAKRLFRRASVWEPRSPAPLRALAIVLQAQGRAAEAVEPMRRAAELAPEDAHLAYNLALAQAEAGQLAEAVGSLEQAVRIDPAFGRAWYNLGLAQAQLGRTEAAIGSLRLAEAAPAATPDYAYARATIHLRLGQADEARQAARAALALAPEHGPSRALLARLGG